MAAEGVVLKDRDSMPFWNTSLFFFLLSSKTKIMPPFSSKFERVWVGLGFPKLEFLGCDINLVCVQHPSRAIILTAQDLGELGNGHSHEAHAASCAMSNSAPRL